jgi:glucosylceramidase
VAAAVVAVVLAGLVITRVLSRSPGASLPVSAATAVAVWETTGDQTQLLAPQPGASFGPVAPAVGATSVPPQTCLLVFCSGGSPAGGTATQPTIDVDDTQRFQQMDGFGGSLTDSSAYVLINDMSAGQRAAVMTQIFDPVNGIGLDYVRVPIGANDFSTGDYTEDDMPSGQADPTLAHFSIAHDLEDLVPVLREALAINPKIRILASPWSAPAWMKTTGSLDGGSLIPADFAVYASYLVRFVQAYAAQGITITGLTMQNEPDDAETSYPGMTLTPADEEALAPILGQDLAAAGLDTQIIGFDSDWSDASYAASLLGTPSAAAYLAGTAFHCYAGDPSAQLAVESAYPAKGIYETECSGTNAYPSFAGNLVIGANSLVIDAVRDYSKTVMLWNLVLDQNFGPTNGGCLDCVPNVTVDSATGVATYNVEHYILGQVSRFVEPGAYRVASTDLGGGSIETVAFANPDGSDVLVVLNASASAETFAVEWRDQTFSYTIPSGALQTFTWAAGAATSPAPNPAPRPRATLIVLMTCTRHRLAAPGHGDSRARCTTRDATRRTKLAPARELVGAVLSRGREVIASGSATSSAGPIRLLLTRRHTISSGTYTLTLGHGASRRRQTVTVAP